MTINSEEKETCNVRVVEDESEEGRHLLQLKRVLKYSKVFNTDIDFFLLDSVFATDELISAINWYLI